MRLVDRYDCVLLDIDGVVMRGDEPIAGASEALARLRREGHRVVFVTNNSARTPAEVASRLSGAGIPAARDEVVTSALATADLLRREGVASAFVVGEAGLRSALQDAGIVLADGAAGADDAGVDAVVIGWDRSSDYVTLAAASLLVEHGARLVATNSDAAYPSPKGLLPGAGALLAVVTTTTGAEPTVVGKPNPELFRAAAARAGCSRPLVVGDRIETDIEGAHRLEWDSLLVLTGVTKRDALEHADPEPTHVGEDLHALWEEPHAPPGYPDRAGDRQRRAEGGGSRMEKDDVMRYVGDLMDRLSPQRAQDLAKQVMGNANREQVSKFAHELVERSQKNRERLAATVRTEVKSQLKSFGLASREEVEALKKRVRELERAKSGTKSAAKKRSAAKRSSSTAKRSSARG